MTKKEKPQQADVTQRLNALVDDLADIAADLHIGIRCTERWLRVSDRDDTAAGWRIGSG